MFLFVCMRNSKTNYKKNIFFSAKKSLFLQNTHFRKNAKDETYNSQSWSLTTCALPVLRANTSESGTAIVCTGTPQRRDGTSGWRGACPNHRRHAPESEKNSCAKSDPRLKYCSSVKNRIFRHSIHCRDATDFCDYK